MSKEPELFLDSNRGVYIPQYFAKMIDPTQWEGIQEIVLDTLKEGPDYPQYWEAWDEVLDNATVKKTGQTLYQDGDLWLVPKDWEGFDSGNG